MTYGFEKPYCLIGYHLLAGDPALLDSGPPHDRSFQKAGPGNPRLPDHLLAAPGLQPLFHKETPSFLLPCDADVSELSGLALHILTGIYLRFGLIGIPEFSDKVKMQLVKKGPFAIMRHPTYLAHSMIFLGAFLITGILTVGLIAVLDFFTVHVIIIPFEEKELQRRFGDEYTEYKRRVPKFFPKVIRHYCISRTFLSFLSYLTSF
ncbi:MAG: isoprenylcysteine carboxylmethyltransferase family protein [Thermodesulfobacteriota bacterium]